METKKRDTSGFMIKQRAFLKVFILTKIGKNRTYGHQIMEDFKEEFKSFGYKPQHSEIYRALHELMEDGFIRRQRAKLDGKSYQEIYVYYIRDSDKVNAYRKLVKADLDRCISLLEMARMENYK